MFILKDILTPLQEQFSNTPQGQKIGLVCIHFTGSSDTIHFLDYLQSIGRIAYFDWFGNRESTVLHLHGKSNVTFEVFVADNVGVAEKVII